MRAPVYVSVLPGAGAASVRTAADGPPPEAAASGGNGNGGGTDGGGTGGGSSGGGGSGGSGEGGEGEEVGGDAALLAVKQYYRVVGGVGGDEARAAEAVRVLDSLTFHQALVFSNPNPHPHPDSGPNPNPNPYPSPHPNQGRAKPGHDYSLRHARRLAGKG